MSLSITVDSTTLQDAFHRLFDLTDDLSPVMSALGMEMENRVRGHFEDQSDPLGVAWMPWKASTVKSYPKAGSGRALDRLGDMLDSVGHVFDKNSMEVGFGDPKAAFHEKGTKRMVRRGLLFADPKTKTLASADESALLDIVERIFWDALD